MCLRIGSSEEENCEEEINDPYVWRMDRRDIFKKIHEK